MRQIRRHTIHNFHFVRTVAALFLVSVPFITPSISSAAIAAEPSPLPSHTSVITRFQTANIWTTIHDGFLELFFGSPQYPSSVSVTQPPPTPSPTVSPPPPNSTTSPKATPVPTGVPPQSIAPTIINHQVTVAQNITPEQLNQIEQQVGSNAQLQISSLQQSLANLTSQLTILQANTARVVQAPIESNLNSVQYPNAVSFSAGNFSGPLTGTTATFTGNASFASNLSVSGALTASQINATDLVSKGPTVDVRAYGATGDGVTEIGQLFKLPSTQSPQAPCSFLPARTIFRHRSS